MPEKKTIQVNKEYFSLGGRNGKKSKKKERSRKKKEKPKQTMQSSKKMRKEFMKKIRDYQKRKAEEAKTGSPPAKAKEENEFESEFSKSLGFLSNMMAAKKKEKRNKTEKIRKEQEGKPVIDIALDMPSEFKTPAPSARQDSNSSSSSDKSSRIIMKSGGATIRVAQAPPYSSLKNGTKPTYREWMKTQKNRKERKSKISIANPLPDKAETERSKRLKAYKKKNSSQSTSKKPRMMKTKRTTKTFKRKLGKSKESRTVSVLIKGRATRKKISGERATLNRTSIHEIKKYLRERNMIKAGSHAPAEVLRKMYEQCILAGDVSNQNGGVLVHNYINED